ncbi:MAG TPA: FkbM family methyltransferase [Pyrinomonadaceae bacterium]|nr:FkbM family methyltransferase [Pyrinomonadaceae bacterium]
MEQSQGLVTGLLKKLLFRGPAKHARLQSLWGRLHTLSIYGMNYGGGGLIEQSGEEWVLENVVAPACRAAETPVVFDVGANVGDYSRLVRRHLPAAVVYAFEPSAAVHRRLAENLASAEGAGRFRPFNLGLSDEEKSVELYSYTVEGEEQSLISSIDRRLPTQVLQVEVSASERVRVRTLDSFCEEEGVARIDFLKLDVEGHELAVLRGARGMLEAGAVSIIQFEFGPANIYSRTYFYDFWSLLSGRFDLYRIIPRGIVPIAYYGEHREVFLTTNYLAVRRPT